MTHRTYGLVSGAIFLLIALGHLLRIVFRVHVVVGDLTIPMWASWPPLVLFGYLAFAGLKQGRKSP